MVISFAVRKVHKIISKYLDIAFISSQRSNCKNSKQYKLRSTAKILTVLAKEKISNGSHITNIRATRTKPPNPYLTKLLLFVALSVGYS